MTDDAEASLEDEDDWANIAELPLPARIKIALSGALSLCDYYSAKDARAKKLHAEISAIIGELEKPKPKPSRRK